MHTGITLTSVAANGTLLTTAAIMILLAWWLNAHVAGNLANLPLVNREAADKGDPVICYIILALDIAGSVVLTGTFIGTWARDIMTAVASMTKHIGLDLFVVYGIYVLLMLVKDLAFKHDVNRKTRNHGRTLPFVVGSIPGVVGTVATGAVTAIGTQLDTVIGHWL
jgi:hypothetical protein